MLASGHSEASEADLLAVCLTLGGVEVRAWEARRPNFWMVENREGGFVSRSSLSWFRKL